TNRDNSIVDYMDINSLLKWFLACQFAKGGRNKMKMKRLEQLFLRWKIWQQIEFTQFEVEGGHVAIKTNDQKAVNVKMLLCAFEQFIALEKQKLKNINMHSSLVAEKGTTRLDI
ncbi:hypothetical protein ACJX0J_006717, partial [Zea mays]